MVWLGLPDGELAQTEGAGRRVQDALRQLAPDLIMTHHEKDYHSDHRAMSRLTSSACTPASYLLLAEPMLGIGPHPDIFIDTTLAFERKCEALGCHSSQSPELMTNWLRTWNTFRGMQMLNRAVTQAEGFMISSRTAAQPDPVTILPKELVLRRF